MDGGGLDELARRQAGLVARRQLPGVGITPAEVRRHLDVGRWAERTPRVVSLFTGRLDTEQRRWLAVLHAGPRSMVGGLTAAEHLGLVGWQRGEITVLVDDELSFDPVPGVRFFRSRRPFATLLGSGSGLPSCRLEPAVLLWAAYDAPSWRVGHALLTASVQQGLTNPARLESWVARLRPLRGARMFRATLADLSGGVQSMLESEVAAVCRSAGLSMPRRQTRRRDSTGAWRYTDCEWDLDGGGVLVLEIDGAFHMDIGHWTADARRQRRLTTRDRIVLRATAFEIRFEPEELVRDLVALGVRLHAA